MCPEIESSSLLKSLCASYEIAPSSVGQMCQSLGIGLFMKDERAMDFVKKYNLTHEKLEQIQQAGIDAQQAKLQEFMMSEGLNEQMYYS